MESLKRKHSSDEEDANAQSKKTSTEYKNNIYNPNLELNKSKKRGLSENLSDSDHDTSIENLNDSLNNNKKNEYSSNLASKISKALNDDFLVKKLKSDESESTAISSGGASISSVAKNMMKKMGHKEGEGIGLKPGRAKPIEESNQVGKQGLGFKVKNFEQKVEHWDYENDHVTSNEQVEWLKNNDVEVPSLNYLLKWKKIGNKKRILDDEFQFCSRETLKQVLDCKSIFDNLDDKDMRNARYRSNPYEAIGSRFFLNRAALKMANLDAIFDFMFTDPKYSNGTSKIEPNEPLYFCDVCAGPGGFSEYVLWRKKWMAKGFGMTLKAENDFNLNDFIAGQPEYFEPHYGQNGVNGDGDVTKSQNLKDFQRFVVEQTDHKGVHFMMADGGFSVEGNENIQEILSKQLYLCQFLCALSVLRTGGNFVCKIFDIFTPFSVGLIYLMYSCFDRISIHKPVTSRPANSERYIICESARETKDVIYNYLFEINDSLNETFRDENSDLDVNEIVPLEILKQDSDFFDYIYNSNEKLGKIQVLNLKKIQAFATNKSLYDPRQSDLITECMKMWKIPDLNRAMFAGVEQQQQNFHQRNRNPKFKPKIVTVPINPRQLLDKFNHDLFNRFGYDLNIFLSVRLNEMNDVLLYDNFKKCSIYDYKTMIAAGQLVLLLGCGRSNVYELELKSPLNCFNSDEINNRISNNNDKFDNWKRLSFCNIELPRETLLLAEKVVEYRGTGSSQRCNNAIHIIDALFIEGQNMIVNQHDPYKIVSIEERHNQLEIFVKSICKKSKKELNTVRLKELIDIENIDSVVLDNLIEKIPNNKEIPFRNGLHIPLNFVSENYVYPSGIYFFKHINNPWSLVLSKKSGQKYYFNSIIGKSTYEFPNDEKRLFSDTRSYFENLLLWKFPNTNDQDDTDESNLPQDIITREKFNKFLNKFKYPI